MVSESSKLVDQYALSCAGLENYWDCLAADGKCLVPLLGGCPPPLPFPFPRDPFVLPYEDSVRRLHRGGRAYASEGGAAANLVECGIGTTHTSERADP